MVLSDTETRHRIVPGKFLAGYLEVGQSRGCSVTRTRTFLCFLLAVVVHVASRFSRNKDMWGAMEREFCCFIDVAAAIGFL